MKHLEPQDYKNALTVFNEMVDRCLYPDGKDIVSCDPEGAGYILYRKIIADGHARAIRIALVWAAQNAVETDEKGQPLTYWGKE